MIIRYNQKLEPLNCIDVDSVSSIDENPIKLLDLDLKTVVFGLPSSRRIENWIEIVKIIKTELICDALVLILIR